MGCIGMPDSCLTDIEEHLPHPQAVFEGLLHEGLLHAGNKGASISAASAAQLRYLVLKNLASLLAAEDASAPRALSLYAQALMLDDGDSVVWNHMGTLVGHCLQRISAPDTVSPKHLRRCDGGFDLRCLLTYVLE